MNNSDRLKILASALIANVFPQDERERIIIWLANQRSAKQVVRGFGNSKLIRDLNLVREVLDNGLPNIAEKSNSVFYGDLVLGEKRILYKSPLPGELQARLSYESICDRFLEYLQKIHQIVVLNESNFHVQVFIPSSKKIDFSQEWHKFITEVAFSIEGYPKYKLPGLKHTLIQMLNSITLAGRGFSTVEVPIISEEQSNVLAAWYLAVVKQVEQRQINREKSIKNIISLIDNIQQQIDTKEVADKEIKQLEKELAKHEKDLKSKQEMQAKEAKKYHEYFLKGLNKVIGEHSNNFQEIKDIEEQLQSDAIKKSQVNKLEKQKKKLDSKLVFIERSIKCKQDLLQQSGGNPFKFVGGDIQSNEELQKIKTISQAFNKTATDQINSTRGDIFTQCIMEMYRLIENAPKDPIPEPLYAEKPQLKELRTAGDDGKDFCYSCGTALNTKNANWKVARFMFERPSQRRQSSNSEDRPFICSSCSVLAFASPLKVTDESIILQLDSSNNCNRDRDKLKDYLRMLTNKELHLSSGRYVILKTEKNSKGDSASNKLGQVQYALLKTASMFPLEVLTDFKFNLVLQGDRVKELPSRHLILLKGLMETYAQKIIAGGDINLKLGDAVRYVERDIPEFAEYILATPVSLQKAIYIEKVRQKYHQSLKNTMNSNVAVTISEDVLALTGLTYAFTQEYKKSVNKSKPNETIKEVKKLIGKVDDGDAFLYTFCSYYKPYTNEKEDSRTIISILFYRNSDNCLIYEMLKKTLKKILDTENKSLINERENEIEGSASTYLKLYGEDIPRVYNHFKTKKEYQLEKDWKSLTYRLQLALSARFPEIIN